MATERSRWDLLANLVVIATGLATISFLGWRFTTERSPQNSSPWMIVQPGEQLTLDDVDFGSAQQTLLLVVGSRCAYCTDSMGFYQRLNNARGRSTRVVAVGSEPVEVVRQYLAGHHVVVDQVVTAVPRSLRIPGTPTLVLADGKGRVLKVWRGRLPESAERQVLAAVAPS